MLTIPGLGHAIPALVITSCSCCHFTTAQSSWQLDPVLLHLPQLTGHIRYLGEIRHSLNTQHTNRHTHTHPAVLMTHTCISSGTPVVGLGLYSIAVLAGFTLFFLSSDPELCVSAILGVPQAWNTYHQTHNETHTFRHTSTTEENGP